MGGGGEKTYSLGELAERIGADIVGNPDIRIAGVSSLEEAGPGQLSFLVHARHLPEARRAGAAALIVPRDLPVDMECALLVCDHVYLAVALLTQLFRNPPGLADGIHSHALVDASAQLGADVRVGAFAQIGRGARVGKGAWIYGGSFIGEDVEVGEGCIIYPNVTILDRCIIGNRAIIHSGAVIGADGFGFAQDAQGHHVKIEQSGIVHIDDDVEIGANTTVDRATFGRTWVQRGAKIDNLVMLAHNVVVGEHSILVGQVGISGSTRIGRHVIMAGQVGVAGHVTVGDGVRIGAKAGVPHSIKPGLDVGGIPAQPQKEWLESLKNVKRLPRMWNELRGLKDKVRELEDALRRDGSVSED